MDKFNYLGVMISTDVGMGDEVVHRVLERRKIWETMEKLWSVHDIKRNKTGII